MLAQKQLELNFHFQQQKLQLEEQRLNLLSTRMRCSAIFIF